MKQSSVLIDLSINIQVVFLMIAFLFLFTVSPLYDASIISDVRLFELSLLVISFITACAGMVSAEVEKLRELREKNVGCLRRFKV